MDNKKYLRAINQKQFRKLFLLQLLSIPLALAITSIDVFSGGFFISVIFLNFMMISLFIYSIAITYKRIIGLNLSPLYTILAAVPYFGFFFQLYLFFLSDEKIQEHATILSKEIEATIK